MNSLWFSLVCVLMIVLLAVIESVISWWVTCLEIQNTNFVKVPGFERVTWTQHPPLSDSLFFTNHAVLTRFNHD